MAMTIEEAIRRIDEHNYIHQRKEPRAVYITEAFDVAVDTMHKYQKIEQIVSDFRKYQKGITWGFGGEKYMQMVSEVVEDGNVD